MSNKLLEMIESGAILELAKSVKDNDITLYFEFGRIGAFVTEFEQSEKIILTLDDMKMYLRSKSEFFASCYGVDVNHYKRWREERFKEHRCHALTSKGKPCQSFMIPRKYSIPNNPANYDPNSPVYCSVHEDRAMNIKK